MAKKDKKKKQGLGMAKTLEKTQKKLAKKQRREPGAEAEDDLDSLLDEFKQSDAVDYGVRVEENVAPPSPRSNASLMPHPNRPEQLILFGGECFDGRQQLVFDDLYLLNTQTQRWTQVHAARSQRPSPRTAHQAVCAEVQGHHYMYVFGGEFTSPSGNQFRHFKDLWRLDLGDWSWELLDKGIKGKAPSARSGHRMVLHRQQLVVFGGFFDTGLQFKQFDDLHTFSLKTNTWTRVQPAAAAQASWPGVRSAPCLVASDHLVFMYGGYKTHPDGDRGAPLTDLWAFDLRDKTATKLSENNIKFAPASARSGSSMVLHKNLALMFGGVSDREIERGEDFASQHFNDMFCVRLSTLPAGGESVRWEPFVPGLQKKSKKGHAQKRDLDWELEEMEIDHYLLAGHKETMHSLQPGSQETLADYVRRTFDHWYNDAQLRQLEEAELSGSRAQLEKLQAYQLTDEGRKELRRLAFAQARVQYMTAEEVSAAAVSAAAIKQAEEVLPEAPVAAAAEKLSEKVIIRGDIVSPRRNAMLAIQGNSLFLYGGVVEQRAVLVGGDVKQHREVTLTDVYELDLRKPERGWRRLQEASNCVAPSAADAQLQKEMDKVEVQMWGDWQGSDEENAEELEAELLEHIQQGGKDDDSDDEILGMGLGVAAVNFAADENDDQAAGQTSEEEDGVDETDEADEGEDADDEDELLPQAGEVYKDYLARTRSLWMKSVESNPDKKARAEVFNRAKEFFDEHSDD